MLFYCQYSREWELRAAQNMVTMLSKLEELQVVSTRLQKIDRMLTTNEKLFASTFLCLIDVLVVFLQYDTIHRLETNKLRNVAKFFAHLLFTDAIPWTVSLLSYGPVEIQIVTQLTTPTENF